MLKLIPDCGRELTTRRNSPQLFLAQAPREFWRDAEVEHRVLETRLSAEDFLELLPEREEGEWELRA